MSNLLPPSAPEDPFDRHGRFMFLVHGVTIGVATCAALPQLPRWLTSVLGTQILTGSALALGLALVVLKLMFGNGWKTAVGMLGVLSGGLILGALVQAGDSQGTWLATAVAAALFFTGIAVIYHEYRRSAREALGMSSERQSRNDPS